jgi:sulfotransferase
MAFHFISGLPRSGSTLLAGLLRQNPRFAAGMSSALGGIVTAALRAMGADSEFGQQVDEERRRRLLEALFHAYYGGRDAAEVVVDTNRMWAAQLPLLKALHPHAKVIACVRNPAWIMDSDRAAGARQRARALQDVQQSGGAGDGLLPRGRADRA